MHACLLDWKEGRNTLEVHAVEVGGARSGCAKCTSRHLRVCILPARTQAADSYTCHLSTQRCLPAVSVAVTIARSMQCALVPALTPGAAIEPDPIRPEHHSYTLRCLRGAAAGRIDATTKLPAAFRNALSSSNHRASVHCVVNVYSCSFLAQSTARKWRRHGLVPSSFRNLYSSRYCVTPSRW